MEHAYGRKPYCPPAYAKLVFDNNCTTCPPIKPELYSNPTLFQAAQTPKAPNFSVIRTSEQTRRKLIAFANGVVLSTFDKSDRYKNGFQQTELFRYDGSTTLKLAKMNFEQGDDTQIALTTKRADPDYSDFVGQNTLQVFGDGAHSFCVLPVLTKLSKATEEKKCFLQKTECELLRLSALQLSSLPGVIALHPATEQSFLSSDMEALTKLRTFALKLSRVENLQDVQKKNIFAGEAGIEPSAGEPILFLTPAFDLVARSVQRHQLPFREHPDAQTCIRAIELAKQIQDLNEKGIADKWWWTGVRNYETPDRMSMGNTAVHSCMLGANVNGTLARDQLHHRNQQSDIYTASKTLARFFPPSGKQQLCENNPENLRRSAAILATCAFIITPAPVKPNTVVTKRDTNARGVLEHVAMHIGSDQPDEPELLQTALPKGNAFFGQNDRATCSTLTSIENYAISKMRSRSTTEGHDGTTNPLHEFAKLLVPKSSCKIRHHNKEGVSFLVCKPKLLLQAGMQIASANPCFSIAKQNGDLPANLRFVIGTKHIKPPRPEPTAEADT